MGATKGIEFLLLIALLVAGSWGWGRGTVLIVRKLSNWSDVSACLTAPLQILLGSSLFLCIGGYLVALNIAWVNALVAWHLLGVFILFGTSLVGLKRVRMTVFRRSPIVLLCSIVAAFAVVVATGVAIGLTIYNVADDDAAYVYLAQRLIATGGLLDPFNFRRMTGYGGNLLYQSMFLKYIGNSSIRGFEIVFAASVLILTVVRTSKRRWLVVGSVVISVGVLLGHGIGPIVNLSPNYSIAMFSLGSFQLLRLLVRQGGENWIPISVLIGLLISSVASLRLYSLVSIVVAITFASFVVIGIRSCTRLAVIGATAILATSGWAIALFRSSNSFVFPIFPGNYYSAWSNGRNPAVAGLGEFFSTFVNLFNSNGGGMVVVTSIVAAATLALVRKNATRDSMVMFAVGVGCLIQALVFCWVLPGSDLGGMTRYLAPSTLTCGLLTIDITWPTVTRQFHKSFRFSDFRSLRTIRHLLVRRGEGDSRHAIRVVANIIISIVLLVVAGIFTFGKPGFSRFAIQTASVARFHDGEKVVSKSLGFYDRYSAFRSQYNRVSLEVPKHSYVLTAVPIPGLLQFSRFRFATLDFPGAASPPPHVPLLDGPDPMVRYLCSLSVRYIIAVGPNNQGLYKEQQWLSDLRDNVYGYWDWTPYTLGWFANIHSLEQDRMVSTSYVGDLALLDIGQKCQR